MESRKKAHPILKAPRESKMEVEEEKEMEPQSPKVSWDEPTLAEHLKLKGTYMKIDEPKTPYHKHSQEQHPMEAFTMSEMTEEERQVQQHLAQAQSNKSKNEKKRLDLTALNAALLKEYRQSGNISEQDEQDEATRQRRTERKVMQVRSLRRSGTSTTEANSRSSTTGRTMIDSFTQQTKLQGQSIRRGCCSALRAVSRCWGYGFSRPSIKLSQSVVHSSSGRHCFQAQRRASSSNYTGTLVGYRRQQAISPTFQQSLYLLFRCVASDFDDSPISSEFSAQLRSNILQVPATSIILSGVRCPWTIWQLCRYQSPVRISLMNRTASLSQRQLPFSCSCRRQLPRLSSPVSNTKYSLLSLETTAQNSIMF